MHLPYHVCQQLPHTQCVLIPPHDHWWCIIHESFILYPLGVRYPANRPLQPTQNIDLSDIMHDVWAKLAVISNFYAYH